MFRASYLWQKKNCCDALSDIESFRPQQKGCALNLRPNQHRSPYPIHLCYSLFITWYWCYQNAHPRSINQKHTVNTGGVYVPVNCMGSRLDPRTSLLAFFTAQYVCTSRSSVRVSHDFHLCNHQMHWYKLGLQGVQGAAKVCCHLRFKRKFVHGWHLDK